MAEWWTNRSLDSSSGVMKPKPLSSLNHFTVPVAMVVLLRLDSPAPRGALTAQMLRAPALLRWTNAQPDLRTVAAADARAPRPLSLNPPFWGGSGQGGAGSSVHGGAS